MKPAIGLAMLVKGNARSTLRRCLDSVRDLVDEAVACVDLRHGDAALGVLDEFHVDTDLTPFKLWTPKCPHFGEMRNRSIDLLHRRDTDWWFYIDADEEMVDSSDFRSRIEWAHEHDMDAVGVNFDTHHGDRLIDSTPQLRVGRVGRVTFEMPIHNAPIGFKNRADCVHSKIRTDYSGTIEDRAPRWFPALHKLWRVGDGGDRHKERRHAAYYLARSYSARQDLRRSQKWARKTLALEPDNPGFGDMWRILCQATFALDGWKAANDVFEEGIQKHPGNADLWHQKVALDVFAWVHTCGNADGIGYGWATSRTLLDGVPEAVKAICLPLRVGDEVIMP